MPLLASERFPSARTVRNREPGSFTGSIRSMIASITLKVERLAPMPRARMRITSPANPGARRSPRTAYRRSWNMWEGQLNRSFRFIYRCRFQNVINKLAERADYITAARSSDILDCAAAWQMASILRSNAAASALSAPSALRADCAHPSAAR